MSEIRFLQRLGDNLEEAARRNTRCPRKNRRVIIAVAVAVTALTGIAAASMLGGSEELAANSIGCYDTDYLGGNVTVLDAGTKPPIRVCQEVRDEQGLPLRQLVACVRNEAVAVFPGESCSEAGLKPLPSDYGQAAAKVERLGRTISRIEASVDCISPEALADKARTVLERQGWDGWRVEVGTGGDGYPCGRITAPSEDGSHAIIGLLDTTHSKLFVTHSLPRSVERKLFGEDGEISTAYRASGRRCHGLDDLTRLIRKRFDAAGFTITFSRRTMPEGSSLADARGRRYEEGCAVIGSISVEGYHQGAIGLQAEIYQAGESAE